MLCIRYSFQGYNLYWTEGQVVSAKTPLQVNGTNCTHPGVTCSSDCKEVVLCVDISGVLEAIVVENCDADTFCDAPSRSCVPPENSTCPDGNYVFQCTSRGFYPDPFDCHKYYVCGKPTGEGSYLPEEGDSPSDRRNTCPSGYAYDSLSTICKTKECKEPVVPRCEEALDTDPLIFNPSIYYMCMKDSTTNKLYPLLFRCSFGVYNPDEYTCTDAD